MRFYFFGANFRTGIMKKLYANNFAGALYTFDVPAGDMFTRVAHHMDVDKKFNYMVAVRPTAMSPQYLAMIAASISEISRDKLQINLIAGHTKPHEKDIGGIFGEVNDNSSSEEKHNFLIKYFQELEKVRDNPLMKFPIDYYVSTTNKYVLEAAMAQRCKMIIPYNLYQQFTIPKDHKVMISCAPILRNTQEEIDALIQEGSLSDNLFLTFEQFDNIVDQLYEQGIREMMIAAWPSTEQDNILEYVKQRKIKELTRR
jgi:alkanesulfonate monooxygenase SsuD/methylene tetrahydromethanopterin reductase-like flavin-dependent oxidoreductase (luciferase family)